MALDSEGKDPKQACNPFIDDPRSLIVARLGSDMSDPAVPNGVAAELIKFVTLIVISLDVVLMNMFYFRLLYGNQALLSTLLQ